MSLFEMQREISERLLKLRKEGALDTHLTIKADWTNDIMRKIVDILAKGKIEDFKIHKAIMHPTKDVGPAKHERNICVVLVASPFKVDEIAKALQKVGETTIDRIQSGAYLFTTGEGQMTFLLKEEEP